jgi:CRP-like cAMP-binding protein
MFLDQYLQGVFGLTKKESEDVRFLFEKRKIKRGGHIQTEGQVNRHLLILETGIIREYYLKDGKEVTKWISKSNSIIVDLSSFLSQGFSRFSLQALEDSELYCISFSSYLQLKEYIPDWSKIETQLITKCFTIVEQRLMQFLTLSAEQRYLEFFEQYKELFNEVPQQLIASMLGMSPETLSRFRAKHTISFS